MIMQIKTILALLLLANFQRGQARLYSGQTSDEGEAKIETRTLKAKIEIEKVADNGEPAWL